MKRKRGTQRKRYEIVWNEFLRESNINVKFVWWRKMYKCVCDCVWWFRHIATNKVRLPKSTCSQFYVDLLNTCAFNEVTHAASRSWMFKLQCASIRWRLLFWCKRHWRITSAVFEMCDSLFWNAFENIVCDTALRSLSPTLQNRKENLSRVVWTLAWTFSVAHGFDLYRGCAWPDCSCIFNYVWDIVGQRVPSKAVLGPD